MDIEKKLANFENEYYYEINNHFVKEQDLVNVKIPLKILAYESYLRKFFGDAFAKTTPDDDFDVSAKKRVERLTKDKLDNSELVRILEDIGKSEFDENLDIILRSK